MEDDEIVKMVLKRYWDDDTPKAVLQVAESAIRLSMELSRDDECEKHRYDGHGEDE